MKFHHKVPYHKNVDWIEFRCYYHICLGNKQTRSYFTDQFQWGLRNLETLEFFDMLTDRLCQEN